jgi:hypothetical protein
MDRRKPKGKTSPAKSGEALPPENPASTKRVSVVRPRKLTFVFKPEPEPEPAQAQESGPHEGGVGRASRASIDYVGEADGAAALVGKT